MRRANLRRPAKTPTEDTHKVSTDLFVFGNWVWDLHLEMGWPSTRRRLVNDTLDSSPRTFFWLNSFYYCM